MPIYVFTCGSCGLQFEKLFRRVSDQADTPCVCGGQGVRQVTNAAFSFAHPEKQTRGIMPSNTGTSDDWNYDKIIGRDAEKRWAGFQQNMQEKDRVIRQEALQGRGITRDHVVKTLDGGYRPITESERKIVNENRDVSFQVSQIARKQASETKT
jgi:putative FmdB family regulatory protein